MRQTSFGRLVISPHGGHSDRRRFDVDDARAERAEYLPLTPGPVDDELKLPGLLTHRWDGRIVGYPMTGPGTRASLDGDSTGQ